MSPARRRAMTLALMPEGQNLFNGKRTLLREEDWQRLEIGDPLDETHLLRKRQHCIRGEAKTAR